MNRHRSNVLCQVDSNSHFNDNERPLCQQRYDMVLDEYEENMDIGDMEALEKLITDLRERKKRMTISWCDQLSATMCRNLFAKQLTSLTLGRANNSRSTLQLSFEDLDVIHKVCNQLTTLNLRCLRLYTTPDQEESVKRGYHSSCNLQTLILDHVRLCPPSWFTFFSKMYPTLQVFSMYFNCEPHINDTVPTEEDVASAQVGLIELAKELKSLDTLSLRWQDNGPLGLTSQVVSEIFLLHSSAPLANVNVFLSIPFSGFETPHAGSRIRQLEATLFPSFLQNTQVFLQPLLQTYSCLKELRLELSLEEEEEEECPEYDIGQILGGCPNLEILHLDTGKIVMSDDSNGTEHHTALVRLFLLNVEITEKVKENVRTRCPRLEHVFITPQ